MINDKDNLIPENSIVIVPQYDRYYNSVHEIIVPMKGRIKRDWFNSHAYLCLPLVIANQYGFGIRSLYDFEVEWNGGPSNTDVNIFCNEKQSEQIVSSHFGLGTITIQNRFHFRTPLGINLMTMNPPNMFIPGLYNLNGVVETDNLRRDFTFNLKIAIPNTRVKIKKGEIISCILPIQRFSVENYEIKLAKDILSTEAIEEERRVIKKFTKERSSVDKEKPHSAGRRYYDGVDPDGNKFYNHQKKISDKADKL
jgi:hypothetical protein